MKVKIVWGLKKDLLIHKNNTGKLIIKNTMNTVLKPFGRLTLLPNKPV